MTPSPIIYDYQVAEVIRVVDGDTYDLTLTKRMDFGFHLTEVKSWAARFRLLKIDAWETNQAGGAKATHDASDWLMDAWHSDVLRGTTYKATETDHFGRYLIDLYRTDTAEHLSDYLRAAGDQKT